MSYRPEFEGVALVQLNGLPQVAFDALVDRVAALVLEPWDAAVIPPVNDPEYRRTVFTQPAAGRSNHEIASVLRLSEGAVRPHQVWQLKYR